MQQRLSADQARLRPHLRERAGLVDEQARVFAGAYRRAVEARIDATAPRWKVPVGDDLITVRDRALTPARSQCT